MKFKRRITLTIVFVVLIPVWFCAMLAFSGVFDSITRDRIVRNAVGSFYEAMRTEKLSDYDFEGAVKDDVNADIILYNNDRTIVYSTIPSIQAGLQFSDSVLTELEKIFSNKTLLLTSIGQIEKSNAHILQNIPGYGKYDLNCAVFWKSGRFLDVHPRIRIIITVFLFCLLAAGLIVSVGTLLLLIRSRTQLRLVVEKYAAGDYSREIPENRTDEDSIISVLNQMRNKILIDEKQKAHIIMGMSHDFKTPLTLIRSYTELIEKQNKNGDEMISKSTKVIGSKVTLLEDMVNEIADYATMRQGDYPIQFKDVNFTDWLVAYARQSENDVSLAGKKLVSDIQTPFDIKLQIDEKLLGRALDNILYNAINYAGGTVKIFSRVYDKDFIEFGIEDDGPGIDKKDKPYIFDLFYRADPARKEGHLGIGLAVVKDIVHSHGWDIEARNAKPHGSIFVITARF